MKKLVYLLLPIWILSCWCCSSGSDEPVVKPDPAPIPQEKIEVTTSEPVIEAKGGKATVGFTTTAAWTITVSRSTSWCTVTPTSGTAGTHELTITTTPNDTYDERNATITITAGQNSKSFTVTQKQKDALTVTSAKNEFTAEGGELVVEVKANISFETIIDEACKEWIVASQSRGLSTTTLKFDVIKNEDLEKREGKITIKSGEFVEEIKVYQEGGKPVVVLTQDEYTVSCEGGDIQVELKSNVDYTVQMPDVDWLSESVSRAMSSHTHHFVVSPNEEYDLRTAEIIFANTELALSDTVRITQVQKNALIVAKNEYTVEGNGGTLEFIVNTNVDIEVFTNVDWIKQNVSSRGLVEKPLSFTIEGNVAYDVREGIITISADDLIQEVVVKQDGRETPFIIKQKEYYVPVEGTKIAVQIAGNKNVTFDLSNLQHNWRKEDFVGKNGDNDVHFFIIGSMDREQTREGSIIIKSAEENYADTVKIYQQIVSEELHTGNKNNAADGHVSIIPYYELTFDFNVYTTLDKYEMVIVNDSGNDWIHHVGTEKTDYGFKELFHTNENSTNKDLQVEIAFIGENLTYIQRFVKKKVVTVWFEEPDVIYIGAEGGTITTHAFSDMDNLSIRVDGNNTSWITEESVDDTFKDDIRRINTTFKIAPNQSGKKREATIVAYNVWNNMDQVTIVQESTESILLSDANFYEGGWEHDMEIMISDEKATVQIDASTPWITLGEAKKENGIVVQKLHLTSNETDSERIANIIFKNETITNVVSIRQLPESGALVDDSNGRWKSYQLPPVDVKKPYPNQMGSMLYFAIVEDPEEFIHIQSRRVLDLLYYTPEDEFIPKLKYLEYVLDNYDGVSACYGGGGMKGIVLSNQYVESYYNANGARALVEENKGVLAHELTHAFQLEPKGCGDYGSSKVFHSCIEGMADAVRVLSGGFPHESDRPKGGHYLDSYRYTGFFIAWCVKNKDKDFLRKFNLSTQYVNPWSFDGAIKYVLGEEYNVEDLWKEYLKAMGDIK